MRIGEVRDAVEGIEDLVGGRQSHRPQVRQHSSHLRLEVEPVVPREVIEDDEAALEQIVTQAQHFLVGRAPVSRLAEIRDGILEQLGIVEREDVAVLRANAQRGQLAEDPGEVPLATRVIVRPLDVLPESAVAAHGVANAREGEPSVVLHIWREALVLTAASLSPTKREPTDESGADRQGDQRDCDAQCRSRTNERHGVATGVRPPRSSSSNACPFSNDGACSSTVSSSRRADTASPLAASERAS